MSIVKDYERIHSNRYYKLIGRVVRSMEKEVLKLLSEHSELGTSKAWDIVISAYRRASNNVGGGYGR